MRKLILAIFTLTAAGLLVMVASPSMAVHKNYNNQLVCGGCHTMHNSQGGTELEGPTGGAIILLRGNVSARKDVHNLCLQCHSSNGSQADGTWDNHTAPKVNINGASGDGRGVGFSQLDSDVTNDTFGLIGAGGDFSAVMSGDSTGWVSTGDGAVGQGRGHSLGLTSATPPGGDSSLSDFTCTSCHDPHGAYDGATAEANQFRNLKITPRGSGQSVTLNANVRSYIGYGGCTADTNWTNGSGTGLNGTDFVWPLFTGSPDWSTDTSACYDAGGRVNAYGVSAGDASDGIANWCAACHDNWHEDFGGVGTNASGDDWKRHPVDNLLNDGSLSSGGDVVIVDTTNYASARSAGRGLPVADASGAAGVFYLKSGAEASNKVFCLSCHFAHAGPYYDNLRWDYLASVGDGSQAANSISSVTGCQLCHNR